MPIPSLHALATISPPDPTPTREAVAEGFGLLLILTTLGVTLIMIVVLLFVVRKNRQAQHDLDRRLTKPSSKASAWHAAGARAEPINPDPDLPSDDDLAPPDDDPRPSDETDGWDLPDRSGL